ncbi:MAG: glutamate synthase subunit beta [Streptococcaceae bacterium]|jgi:glutamate synthase (NADPH/NADH) small chain|nr:glutamate synthase subunit beta [Streptococcaceae bacterium]
MADPFGFLKYKRKDNPYRDVEERIRDWNELQTPLGVEERQTQASRCMSCGVPFCHQGNFYGETRAVSGCPNDNLIPEWNDYLSRGDVKNAFFRLSRTNPLPEMTGRVCPAPCEAGCTEYLNGSGVTIHDNERFIIDRAFEEGWIYETGIPTEKNGKRIAIVGSGPAGLSAAWRANQVGFDVTVFEKNDRFGGLLMYGIPNMKLDKSIVQRRINVMEEVGVSFIPNMELGGNLSMNDLRKEFDSIVLAIGAGTPRAINVKGKDAEGVEFAVDFLTKSTKAYLANEVEQDLVGEKVIIVGGGDTGNDCIATAVRRGAKDILQLEILPKNPKKRGISNPWPEYPRVNKVGYGQEEAEFVMKTDLTRYQKTITEVLTDESNRVVGAKIANVAQDFSLDLESEEIIPCDRIILAMGFTGVEKSIFQHAGVTEVFDDYTTNDEDVFVVGDAKRGPSLVIWAIREGRKLIDGMLNKEVIHNCG